MSKRRVPLPVAVAYTAFMAVLVPVYWYWYTPTNFLYFCDVALFLTVACVWTQSPLLAGMCAVGIVLPQMLWVANFVVGFAGLTITGMTGYMFDGDRSLFLRGLSLFHGWLPFLLLYLVRRLGYDRRSLVAWTATAWVLMLVCFFLMPPPGATDVPRFAPVNINYVYGFGNDAPQAWMPAWAWLTVMLVGMPVLVFLPTHLFLTWWGRATPPSRKA